MLALRIPQLVISAPRTNCPSDSYDQNLCELQRASGTKLTDERLDSSRIIALCSLMNTFRCEASIRYIIFIIYRNLYSVVSLEPQWIAKVLISALRYGWGDEIHQHRGQAGSFSSRLRPLTDPLSGLILGLYGFKPKSKLTANPIKVRAAPHLRQQSTSPGASDFVAPWHLAHISSNF